MKTRFTKFVTLAVSVFLTASLTIGCSSGNKTEKPGEVKQTETKQADAKQSEVKQPEKKPAEKRTIRYLVPGDASPESDLVDQEISKKMQESGLNLELKRVFIGWDVWDDRVNVMMSTGEEFDLIHVMEDRVKNFTYAGKGGIVAIDEYIDKYGPTLKKLIPPEIWDLSKINGKIMGIPVMFRDFSYVDESVALQKQLFDKSGLPVPKTPDELLTAMDKIAQDNPGKKFRLPTRVNQLPAPALQRAYDSYPFVVIDNLVFVDQKGNIKPWLETEEFKKDCTYFRALYKKGFIDPDILTMPVSKRNAAVGEGNWAFNLKHASTDWAKIKKSIPDLDLYQFIWKPEQPRFRGIRVVNNYNSVSSTSKHPEVGVQFYNWVYSSQENYDLLNFGIKDKHWKETGPREFDIINPEKPAYTFGDWEMGHYTLARVQKGAHPGLKDYFLQFDPKAENSIVAGFNFDTSKIAVEYANCSAEIEASIFPIKYGVVEFSETLPNALKKMKAAGYDKVVAEYDKQFKAWLASKTKK